jgi:hypothetical protein
MAGYWLTPCWGRVGIPRWRTAMVQRISKSIVPLVITIVWNHLWTPSPMSSRC